MDLKRFVQKRGTLLGYLSLPRTMTATGHTNDTALVAVNGIASEEAMEMGVQKGTRGGWVVDERGQKGTLCPGED